MTLKILLEPREAGGEGGITTAIRAHLKYFPDYGIEVVEDPALAHVHVIHAGMSVNFFPGLPVVAMLHGLYWTNDYYATDWEFGANANVIENCRYAHTVTVPSPWVAEALQRDMHLSPVVVPHGIDWAEWQHKETNGGFVLWNKNRVSDACDPTPVTELALRAPYYEFMTTYATENAPENVTATGVMDHATMKVVVQSAGVYLSTTKETFGIGVLEAMASGVPVLGYAFGGNLQLVKHGETGYLAQPGDLDDLAKGLEYCVKHRATLSYNARRYAKEYAWDRAMKIFAQVLHNAAKPRKTDVTVVIPCYNYGHLLGRAVESVLNQSVPPKEIIIVDNNSTTPYGKVDNRNWSTIQRDLDKNGFYLASNRETKIRYLNEKRQGVAHARNAGGYAATSEYLCFLDADDEIKPTFLEQCVRPLNENPSIGVTYSRLQWIDQDGETGVSDWPGEYDYDAFLRKKNQVPTCSVIRRSGFLRLGGFRQRFAPEGAGAEDAEFYLRLGAIGLRGVLATEDPLFVYHTGQGYVSGNPDYQEEDWLTKWHPWVTDRKHPFASLATPLRFSHAVRQYDEPLITVVIPVGPDHERYLVDALDSLEAQGLRKWEVVVVFDTGLREEAYSNLLLAYPYIRPIFLSKTYGAGYARNRGAEIARARLLLFLDADDWLEPSALEEMYTNYVEHGKIITSNYIGHAQMEIDEARRLDGEGRLLEYRRKTGMAQTSNEIMDFDCKLALRQPELNEQGQFYIWSLVTSLVPRRFHVEIGGFDEKMKSWEDWDYYIRLARAGKCFYKVPSLLVNYHFHSGERRELGKRQSDALIEHMQKKYSKETKMPGCCTGGGGGEVAASQAPHPLPSNNLNRGFSNSMANPVMVQLNDGNSSDHHISIQGTSYGYRTHGEQFLMLPQHQAMFPQKFPLAADIVVEQQVAAPEKPEPRAETPAPTKFTVEDDGVVQPESTIEFLPGLREAEFDALIGEGVLDLQDVIKLGEGGLKKIRGISAKRAKEILAQTVKTLNGEDE